MDTMDVVYLVDFEIVLNEPYDLCDFKVAYGEIFQEYLEPYDFWGFCDCDLIYGDIRHFLTEELLEKPWYISCGMSKYIAYIIDTLNHDSSISDLLNPNDRIQSAVIKYKESQKTGIWN